MSREVVVVGICHLFSLNQINHAYDSILFRVYQFDFFIYS